MGCIRADIRVGEFEGVGLFNDLLDAKPSLGRGFDITGPVNGAMGLKEPKDGVGKEGFIFWVCLLVVEGEQGAVEEKVVVECDQANGLAGSVQMSNLV